MAIDVTPKNIIDYYGTWYRSNRGSLMVMFGDLEHILDGLDFEDDGETMAMKGSSILVWLNYGKGVHPMDEIGVFDKHKISIVPLEGILICLKHMMQNIVEGCTQGGVAFCDPATLNHESCGKNSKHFSHKSKWIITPRNAITSCRWSFKVFDS